VAFAPDNDWPFVADVIFTSNGGESTNSVTGTGLTPGHIMVTPAAQDLDTLATGTTAQATFTVANSGGTAVSNGTAAVSGPFSILAGASFSVPGFGSTDVVVEFAPASPGAFTNNVIFTTANGGDATNPVTGTGAIVPVADFSASPTNGAWPLAVTFTDTSTGTINYRSWDLGDGPITNTTATTLNHTYAAAGTYTVTLFVSGPLGFSDLTRTDYIVVVNPPVADFSATPTNGLMPLLVNFTDASTGDVTNRLWSFGDGDTSNDTNPSHTYTNVGTYSVTLTDYGPYGTAEKTQTNLITVSAVLATWTNANVSGNWSEAPSWDPVAIPDYGSSVIFGAAGTTSVVDGVSRTVGNITFDRAADFFVSAAGEATLTINNGIAVLTIFTYTISPPLLLGADNVWSVTTGGILLVTGPVSGTNSITEIGGGTLVLSGTNTYEGGTTVSNGILLVNNSGGSGTGTGVVQVVSGAILGGDGVIEGPVTIADGGLLSPGSDGVGALTISNNLALDSASVLQYELGTNSDLTAVSGNLTLDGILNITDAGGFTNGTYTLFTYGGTLTTNGSPTILTIGTTPDTNLIYTVDISSSGSVVLIVVASPPVADFSGSPTSGPWPLTMTFTDTSTGYITDRFWDFGDGNTTNTTETSLEYTYTAAGTYTVSLTVRGPGGTNTITRSDYVAVVNPPHLEVAPESLDYGSVTIGQTNSLTFSVINTGDVTLDGTATSVSPFNLISGASYTVAAGQTQTVVVAFAPDNDWPFVADVIFTSNGGESTNSVTGTGLTPGHITVTPAAQDFDTLATGTTAQATFTVANSGGTAVSNGTASVSGPFSILAGASFSVPGFGSTNVVVEFAPASAGTFTNNVIFTTANGGDATNPVTGTGAIVPVADFSASPTNGAWPLAVTFTDTSTGTINYRSWDLGDGPITNTTATSLSHTYAAAGTYTVTLFVSGPLGFNDLTRTNYIVVVNPPNLVINPGSLTYGSVTIGQTNSLSFSVINTGEATLSGTATSAAPFAVAGGAVYSVAGGQTQTVTVAFAPGTSGTFNDSVIFTSNGGDSTNAVNGTGLTSGSITVTPTAHDFGTLATGTTAQTSFTVTNSGGTAVSNGTATVSSPYTIVSGATFSVAGFSSTNVVVRFAPVSAGDFTNNVIFATANGGVATNAVTGTGAIVPVASFSASPTNGPWPLAVTFTDGSTGTITNRHWDLGDGTTTNTTATTLNHTYASVGTNTVSLTVSGPVGPNNQTRSAYIVVVNPSHLVVNPGSRNFGSVTIGRTDNLSFSVINTGDLPLSGTASSAAPFSVSSGGAYNNLAGGQTQTVTVAFAPSSAGAFTGSVIFASDGGNSTNTVIGTGLTPGSISVTPAVHDFGALATGTTVQASFVVTNAGGTAVSNGTAAVLGGPFAIMAGATFSVPGLGTSNITVQFAPVSAGAFTNSVTFASDNGGSATNTVIGTGAIVPVASFTGTPTNGALPLAVTFTDNSSGTITDRFWNFGDGNTSNTIATSVSHSYSVAGTNMVSLTVSGPVGTNTQTRSNYIVAHNPPVANFSASPTLGPVALTVTFTDSSTGNITNRFWNFGDGHTTNTLAASLGHTYNAFGTNTVSLTVFGMGGWCATNRVNYVVVTNFVVDVTPPQLQIVSPMDYQAFTNANITVTGVASDASGINGVTVNGSAASAAGTNWSQSVTLSLGTNTFAVIAIDASPKLNAATQTVHAVLLPNHPPQITAGLSVTNALLNVGNTSVVVANDTNMFAVSATDVDGNLLNYQWDFGDGRNGNSLVAIVGHVYTNDCGPYNASVTVSDGQVSTNSGRTVIVACQMQITKMQVKLSFSKPNADSCSLTANIVLPNGFTTAGKSVTLNISGAQSSFTLDAKGKGVNAQGSCGFKFNKKTGGWTISVKLGKTNLQDAWADDGLANTTLPKTGTSVTLTVAVLVDDEAFAADRTLLYRTAAGKSGSAK
jgi:PKD repeat protein